MDRCRWNLKKGPVLKGSQGHCEVLEWFRTEIRLPCSVFSLDHFQSFPTSRRHVTGMMVKDVKTIR